MTWRERIGIVIMTGMLALVLFGGLCLAALAVIVRLNWSLIAALAVLGVILLGAVLRYVTW